MQRELLIQIIAPHFVAGINTLKVSDDEFDNKCVPIIKYMKHWSPYQIREYCIKKGWGIIL